MAQAAGSSLPEAPDAGPVGHRRTLSQLPWNVAESGIASASGPPPFGEIRAVRAGRRGVALLVTRATRRGLAAGARGSNILDVVLTRM